MTRIDGFDIDERALAYAELKMAVAKMLDFHTACRFLNMSKYRDRVCGEMDHDLLDPSLRMAPEEFHETYRLVTAEMSPAARALIRYRVDASCGFDCLASLEGRRRLANPAVLPWLNRGRYERVRERLVSVRMHKASLDPRYGRPVKDVLDARFDLVWPINALDHGVDFFSFLNFLIEHCRTGGHVMVHFGIKDPFLSIGDALTDIINLPGPEYSRKVAATSGQPVWVISVRDVLEALGFRLEEALLAEIADEYFPRPENVWWDDDIRRAWAPGNENEVGNVLHIYEKTRSIDPLTPEAFRTLALDLPRELRRGFITSEQLGR